MDGQLLVNELDQVHAWRVAAHTDDAAAPPASQGADQLLLCRHRSRGLDPGVGPLAIRQCQHTGRHVLFRRVDRGTGPELPRQRKPRRRQVHGDHVRAHRVGEEHCRQPHRAYSEDDQPFGTVRRQAREALVSGAERTGQQRPDFQTQCRRQRQAVAVVGQ